MPEQESRERRIARAAERCATALFDGQRPDGTWPNPRPPAAVGTAAAVLALCLADRGRSAGLIGDGARWLIRHRNADGGWGLLTGSPSDPMATSLAVAALHLAEPGRAAAEVADGLALLESWGGVRGLSDAKAWRQTGLVLSLAGLYDPAEVPRLPAEALLLPAGVRRRALSYYASGFSALSLLQLRRRPWSAVLRPVSARVAAIARDIVERSEEDEGGVGSHGSDPMLTGLICAALQVAGECPRLVRAAVGYLRSVVQPDGSWQLIHGPEVRRDDVIGAAVAGESLARAGHAADARLLRTAEWVLSRRQDRPFPVFGCPPGGWTWTGGAGWPSVYDSVPVLKFLAATGAHDTAVRAGAAWLRRRQDSRGSWSTFVRDTREANDGPCPFTTAQAVDVLVLAGASAADRAVRRALRWLTRVQRPDGSHPSTWNRGGVPATAAVLSTLTRLGLGGRPVAARARGWLLAAQLPDGSWGAGPGAEPGTAEETARATRALAECGGAVERAAAERGLDWLLAAQRPDGRWDAARVCVFTPDHGPYPDGLITQGLALGALTASQRAFRDAALSTGRA
ncbi:prenyltransferase/squalene oxidase repeat-containing protein [Streptomyces litchfieldiae]|uniref:Prenyltransferase/squalene oxidase repeat-containing protein n=1 Tax=Streptomyces litchfieldiae TaxID=3075543 RepID=A0ABU2MIV2_9ACTN|nr:prenyltransferase/squalene oxidase repeat-containing protein [Streptomyces sp. DSM 44938]MDT0341308.1 prenyltransferase/squalene oxidase repeat-containing protein [Streptomyces sp. DSM 44938]